MYPACIQMYPMYRLLRLRLQMYICIQHVFVTDAQETCADTSVIQRGYMRDTYIIRMEYVFPSGNSMDTNVSCCYAFTIHQTHYNTQRIHCRMHVLSGRHAIHTTIHAGYIRNTLQSCILCPDTRGYICIQMYPNVSRCIPNLGVLSAMYRTYRACIAVVFPSGYVSCMYCGVLRLDT